MYLPANATRALVRLGPGRRLIDRARRIDRQRFFDHRGRLLLDVELSGVWVSTGPCVAVGRSELHEVMREGIAVRLGVTVTAIHDDGPRVHADFTDGTSTGYDLVVGADGIHSWTRASLFGHPSPALLGQVSRRFVVDGFPDLATWTVWLGRGAAFLAIPLGAGRIYCYADHDAIAPTDPSGDKPVLPELSELFGRFAEPVPTILAAGLADARVHVAPIEEVVIDRWVRGRVVLVGDAAHGMSPNMAGGAGLAVEDALVLAEILAAGGSLEEFQARRQPRVAFVRARTRRRDRTRSLRPGLRNVALRLAGRRIVRSGYAPLRGEP